MKKAACHPNRIAAQGIMRGAIREAALVPELKIPVASALSSTGNQSAVAFRAAGKFPDSPRPSANRAMPKPTAVRAKAWLIDAMPHTTIDRVSPFFAPMRSMILPETRKPRPYATMKQVTMLL